LDRGVEGLEKLGILPFFAGGLHRSAEVKVLEQRMVWPKIRNEDGVEIKYDSKSVNLVFENNHVSIHSTTAWINGFSVNCFVKRGVGVGKEWENRTCLKGFVKLWGRDVENRGAILGEYRVGGSLEKRLQKCKDGEKLSVELAVKWSRQLIEALSQLNVKGMAHRDMKSANIVLCCNCFEAPKLCERAHVDADYEVKLCDFGSTKELNVECGVEGASVLYAPLSVLQEGHLTARADVWALGVVLWELHGAVCGSYKPVEEGYRTLWHDNGIDTTPTSDWKELIDRQTRLL
jgi:serine/threonine protein kinase